MKPITWDDALRLNGSEGYTGRDALEARDRELKARPGGPHAVRRSWAILGREERSCEKHGAFQSQLEQLDPAPKHPMFAPRWTTCPACDQEIEAEERERSPASAEMKRVMAKMRLVNAGLPEMYFDTTWRQYADWGSHGPVRRKGMDYERTLTAQIDAGKNLVLYGNPRTGKTMMACIILKKLLVDLGGSGKYLTQARFISRLKAAMDTKGETEDGVFRELVSLDLLVLDEVGRGSSSDWEKSCVFRLIDERYQRGCKPMIVVSNLSEKDLEAFLSTAAWLRLKNKSAAIIKFGMASVEGEKGGE